MNAIYRFCAFLLVCTLVFSCEESGSNGGQSTDRDSLTVEVPDTLSVRSIPDAEKPAVEPSPLIGRWQLQEMWVGNSIMSVADVGENFLTFKASGVLISEAPLMAPDSSGFRYDAELHAVEATVLQGAQKVKSLTDNELVLTYQVDGDEIRAVYARQTAP